jgi:predicted DNA-binding transcriptional regulator YafY
MRADRLLALLMLLQTRGKLPARALAEELEVSERTIYRDMVALNAAGIPVYAERGPGGGCALVDSYRTTLTGLSEAERHALFTLSIPAPLAELGLDQELRMALLKLSAASETSGQDEALARQRIYLDWEGWTRTDEPVHHLRTIYTAICQEHRLRLVLRLPFETHVERQVDPYGLVARGGAWRLVCARQGELRVYRVSHILEASSLEERFQRLAGFDLQDFWKSWYAVEESNQPLYEVEVRISPELLPWLPGHFGDWMHATIAQAGPPDEMGWLRLTLPFESLEAARERILGWGRAVEVLSPLALRKSVIDIAEQVVEFYRSK